VGVSDDAGHFEIVGLPPGYLTARLQKNPRWVAPTDVSVAAGQEEILVEVDPLVPFTVTVVDARGARLPGVLVTATWGVHGISESRCAETDEAGRIVLPAVPRSTEIAVATEWHRGAPELPDVLQWGVPARDGELELSMPDPVVLAGTVVDATGRPLESGVVTATPIDEELAQPSGELADLCAQEVPLRDGSFRIGRLHAGRYRVVAYGPAALGWMRPVEVQTPQTDLTLRLEAFAEVTGRVLDADSGLPALVQWFTGGLFAPEAMTDAEGHFRIDYAVDGRGTLYVFQPGTGACALLEDVRPADGPFRVALGESRAIAGRVTGTVDRRRSPRLVCVRGPIQRPVCVRADGTFEIPGLPPGAWRLEWHHGTDVLGGVEVHAGDTGLVVPFPRENPETRR
jgi:hypothetical protein